ncbi:MAG: DNA double-strand break repair nuclease NurA [Candidatus Aenigmatarchaeota archaeon]
MQNFISRLSSAAESIKSMEEKKKALAEFLMKERDKFSKSSDVIEENLIYKVVPQILSGKKIVAVDGGLSHHSYHGLELALLRAVAVLFNYDGNGKSSVSYYPESSPSPEIILVSDPYNDSGLDVNNERMRKEIETASAAAKKFSPDLLLMDGMIVPHINDIPKEGSGSHERFLRTVESFRNLYDSASGLLAGCIEDSRGKRLCEILSKNEIMKENVEMKSMLEITSDTSLLFYLLDYGERTCAFRFSGDGLTNILGERGKNIYSFYMKTAKFDRPVRVDFYCKSGTDVANAANEISSLILSTCCHDSYGFPAPLIEADFRAKLPEDEIEKLRDQLLDRIGIAPSLMKMRRELRPL